MSSQSFRTLDTYPADLRNEKPPRRENVTEIQDAQTGELLCYANPDKAAFIVQACGAKPTTQQAQTITRQLGTDKANASAEIARLRAVFLTAGKRALLELDRCKPGSKGQDAADIAGARETLAFALADAIGATVTTEAEARAALAV